MLQAGFEPATEPSLEVNLIKRAGRDQRPDGFGSFVFCALNGSVPELLPTILRPDLPKGAEFTLFSKNEGEVFLPRESANLSTLYPYSKLE